MSSGDTSDSVLFCPICSGPCQGGWPLCHQCLNLQKGNADESLHRLLGNKYEISAVLGAGAMSTVYQAKNLLTERMVAVKVLHPYLVADATSMRRFQQEARALSVLNHPSIVSILTAGTTEAGCPYLVMELIEGETLASVLARRNRLPAREALPIFKQICAALVEAHFRGIIHRDLKPSNIIISGNQTVKLADFGIALLADKASRLSLNTPTTLSVFVGSAPYVSPEQCTGGAVDARSDLYSLGCTFYETLTGKPPFSGDTAMAVLTKHVNEAAQDPASACPEAVIPQRLQEIVMQLLAKRPQERIQSASDLMQELERLDPAGMPASPAMPAPTPAIAAPRHHLSRWTMIVMGSLAAAGILFGGWAILAALESPHHRALSSTSKLKDQLASERDPKLKLALMNALARCYEEHEMTQKAIETLEEAQGYAEANFGKQSLEHARQLILKGNFLRRGGSESAAKAHCVAAKGILFHIHRRARQLRDPVTAEICSHLALAAQRFGDPENYPAEINYLKELGVTYLSARRFEEAERHFHKAIATANAKKKDPRHDVAICLKWLGDMRINQNDLKSAQEYYRKAAATFAELQENDNLAECLHHWAQVKVRMGEIEQAVSFAERALALKRSTYNEGKQPDATLWSLYQFLGDNLQAAGQYRKAKHYFKLALGLRKVVPVELYLGTLHNIAGIELRLKNNADACRYASEFLQLCAKPIDADHYELAAEMQSVVDLTCNSGSKASQAGMAHPHQGEASARTEN